VPIKKLHPPIIVNFKKDDHAVRLNYAQVEAIVRKILFEPSFLKQLKRSMEAV
jgi:hypothetical protein